MTIKGCTLCFALFLLYGACHPVFAVSVTCANTDSATESQAKSPPPEKAIHDTIELADYAAALNTQSPGEKASKMEAFADRYPESVVFAEALENALNGYQQSGNLKKAAEIGKRVLQLEPDHVRALMVLAFQAETEGKAKEAGKYAERGLKALPGWPKPPEASAREFSGFCAQAARLFYRGVGFSALSAKDYRKARDYLIAVYATGGGDLQALYRLAIAELEMEPPDIHGFWYLAKAVEEARAERNVFGAEQIEIFGRNKYRKYHGSDEGWAALLAGAESCGSLPPSGETHLIIHGVPASAGDGVLHGVPSSVGSPTADGRSHGVPASVSSPTPDGSLHGVAASVTSPRGSPAFSFQSAIKPCEQGVFVDIPGAEGVIDGPSREANAASMIPAGFLRSIKRRPTPQELACQLLDHQDPDELSMGVKEFVLGFRDAAPCNKAAAERVWAAILKSDNNGAVPVWHLVRVIEVGQDFIDVAANEDPERKDKADIRLRLDLSAYVPPQPGEMINIKGVFTSYTPDPFMFTMEQGELDGRAKPVAKHAAKKAAKR